MAVRQRRTLLELYVCRRDRLFEHCIILREPGLELFGRRRRRSPILVAATRVIVSRPPPGAMPTMMRMGRVGYSVELCWAAWPWIAKQMNPANTSVWRQAIMSPSHRMLFLLPAFGCA